MSDAVVSQEQTDVNSQEAEAGSSSAQQQEQVSTPPTDEKSEGTQSSQENRIPQSRFNEVIEQKNAERAARLALEEKIRNLEAQQPKRESVAEQEVKRLVAKLNMSEEAAREIVQTHLNLTQSQQAAREAQDRKFRAENWAAEKAKADKEYAVLEPELDKAFSSLAEDKKVLISSDPDMLEMFYESVKSRSSAVRAKEAADRAAAEAYKNKQMKQAVSSVPGGSASGGKTPLTRKGIAAMSEQEYKERQSEINEALLKGTLK